eukprot:3003446-Prorocentrum_lima.AAC.1
MTSSLVGSEMCIRDSFNTYFQAGKRKWDRQTHGLRKDLEKHRERKNRRPVSYTHLTLPTICSV